MRETLSVLLHPSSLIPHPFYESGPQETGTLLRALTRLVRSRIMSQSTTTTRQTKACKIDRTIEVSLDHEPWGPTCYATVLETRHLKTKTHRACDCYRLERVRCDIGGIAVLVTKQDGGTNHVHLCDVI